MTDQNKNPPSLLLFSANDSLMSNALRPVPATASLFPTEEGEADSFLGQTDGDAQAFLQTVSPQESASVPPQPTSTPVSFFQGASPVKSDSFVGISTSTPSAVEVNTSVPLMVPPPSGAGTFQSPGPPPLDQMSARGFQSPPQQPPMYQQGPPPPSGPSGAPPTGPPVTYGLRGFQHKPMAYPMDMTGPASVGPPPMSTSGPITGFPPPSEGVSGAGQPNFMTGAPPPTSYGTGPPPSVPMGLSNQGPTQQFNASRPPPTAAELNNMNIHAPVPPNVQVGPQATYRPVVPHWFYCKESDSEEQWNPFSYQDSYRLEEALRRSQETPDEIIIPTNGGRYDVNIRERTRHAIYWVEADSIVQRCTWFYRSDGGTHFLPYDEYIAEKLEAEYKAATLQNMWNRRLELSEGEAIVMHNPNVIVHFRPSLQPNEPGTMPDQQMRPRVVKRGVDDIDQISQGEPDRIDHLVFVVHGIGGVCDFRFRDFSFRTIVEAVEDFRKVSHGLMQTHFRQALDDQRVGRVEYIPVYWYNALHGDATGVDRRLRNITLPSILRLRRFTNETLLDILFYSSPAYCQQIAEVVANEMNRLYELFRVRNPSFNGGVSIVGHSLGSLIVFDLLSHQGKEITETKAADEASEAASDTTVDSLGSSLAAQSINDETQEEAAEEEDDTPPTLEEVLSKLGLQNLLPKFEAEMIDMESLVMCDDTELKDLGIPLGPRKKLRGYIKEQAKQQEQKRKAAEARLEEAALREAQLAKAALDQQAKSSNDLSRLSASAVNVDYQIGTEGVGQPFIKYPHLDFVPTHFFALGSPIGMFLTVRGLERVGENYKLPLCENFYNIFHPFDPVAYRVEPLIHPSLAEVKPVLMPHHKGRKRLHLELRESITHFGTDLKNSIIESMKRTWRTLHEFALAHRGTGATDGNPTGVTEEEMEAVAEKLSQEELNRHEQASQNMSQSDHSFVPEEDLRLGKLNRGRRIDYVLQEAPFESFNEYMFALGSHTCYWQSEDTLLMILKEVYLHLGVFPQSSMKDSTPPTPRGF